MTVEQLDGVAIGDALARARERQGVEIDAMAERTKIRARYLTALETEDWEALPSLAYARGFLRTYAAAVGLDADQMVDEFRRQVEAGLDADELAYPLGEQRVLEERRRPGNDRARLSWLPGLVIVALVIAAGWAGQRLLWPGEDEAAKVSPAAPPPAGAAAVGATEPFELKLEARDDMELCLVAGDDRALIDSQAIDTGAKEGPFTAERFRLDVITGGAVRAEVSGEAQRLSSAAPARWIITAGGAREVAFGRPGRSCP